MTALTANFVPPPGPVSAEAFGGLIDLSRVLLHSDPSTTVVCETCRTINRDSALFCKGCAGKLPAFYATGAVADNASHAPGIDDERTPTVLTLAISVLGFTAALATMLALLGLWYGGGTTVEPPPVSTATSPAAVTPVAAPSVLPVALPAMASSLHATSSGENPTAAVFVDERPAPPATGPALKREPRAHAQTVRKTSALPPEQRAASFRRSAPGPLASCDGRNFIAHAVCVNNRCAQPGSAHHPQCKKPLSQRRQDEARRNLFLGN
ncbi:hypothetical protein LJR130_005148 [Variovorax sp. LjRoot130]|uniref:hypothetical protein n=1 Tax=Variovorax sp. LjRoot130 TaxID=3342261 RepID=UPI003ED124A9